MKILIANAIYPTDSFPKILGGAEKSVRKIAEGLADLGHEVHVVVPAGPNAKRNDEFLNQVHIHRIATRNLYDFHEAKSASTLVRMGWHILDDLGRVPAELSDLFEEICPDVFHTNTLSGLSTGVWKIASRHNVPVVHTLRDYYLLCTKCTLYRNNRICKKPCNGCAISTQGRRSRTKFVDGIVGNSRFTLDLHLENDLFEKAIVKKAIGSISEMTDETPSIFPRVETAGKPIVFGYIGRISPTKGLEDVLQAITQPSRNEKLVISGALDSAFAQDLLERFSSHERVTFTGFISPAEFYTQVDIVVASSLWYEPLPRSVVDALSFGKPVVGSNRGGTPEAMGSPPRGWIYDPALPGDLTRAIDEAKKWAQSGGSFAGIPAPTESVLDAYLGVYESVIAEKPAQQISGA